MSKSKYFGLESTMIFFLLWCVIRSNFFRILDAILDCVMTVKRLRWSRYGINARKFDFWISHGNSSVCQKYAKSLSTKVSYFRISDDHDHTYSEQNRESKKNESSLLLLFFLKLCFLFTMNVILITNVNFNCGTRMISKYNGILSIFRKRIIRPFSTL